MSGTVVKTMSGSRSTSKNPEDDFLKRSLLSNVSVSELAAIKISIGTCNKGGNHQDGVSLERSIDDPGKICSLVHCSSVLTKIPTPPIFGKNIKVNQHFSDEFENDKFMQYSQRSKESKKRVSKSRSRSKSHNRKHGSRSRSKSITHIRRSRSRSSSTENIRKRRHRSYSSDGKRSVERMLERFHRSRRSRSSDGKKSMPDRSIEYIRKRQHKSSSRDRNRSLERRESRRARYDEYIGNMRHRDSSCDRNRSLESRESMERRESRRARYDEYIGNMRHRDSSRDRRRSLERRECCRSSHSRSPPRRNVEHKVDCLLYRHKSSSSERDPSPLRPGEYRPSHPDKTLRYKALIEASQGARTTTFTTTSLSRDRSGKSGREKQEVKAKFIPRSERKRSRGRSRSPVRRDQRSRSKSPRRPPQGPALNMEYFQGGWVPGPLYGMPVPRFQIPAGFYPRGIPPGSFMRPPGPRGMFAPRMEMSLGFNPYFRAPRFTYTNSTRPNSLASSKEKNENDEMKMKEENKETIKIVQLDD